MKFDQTEISRREAIVINEYGGIQTQYVAFYVISILYCAELANSAFERYKKSSKDVTATMITSLVHEALGHAAALSRFFWPPKTKALSSARAKRLRDIFEIKDDSALRERELRNALEHFDERLDVFLLTNDAGFFFPTPMIGNHGLADDPVGKIFKLVDPENDYAVILGEKCHFGPIIAEVVRILKIAKRMSA